MSDLHHYIGDDLSVSSTGDLMMAESTKEGEQRVLRRLLTNPTVRDGTGMVVSVGDCIWHPDYGAGVPVEVGKTLDERRIRALIRKQIFNEACVARNPDPVILVEPITDGVSVRIQYVDAVTRQQVGLSFTVQQ
jgi:hypothetical protein